MTILAIRIAFSAEPTPALPSGNPVEPSNAPAVVKTEPPRKSQNVTINLINRLVERGVLSKEDAAELIKQAEEDAAEARAQANAIAAIQSANPPLTTDANGTVRAPAPPTSQPANVAELDVQSDTEDTIRVPYIPESVKAQLREEIKEEVMQQARDERWAAPRTMPEWVSRVRLFADIRMRYEGDFFPDGNDNTGAFPNFNAINTGPPFDITGTTFSPQLNVDQDRERIRLRVRLGVAADLGDNFTAGIRLGTGENNSPVTTNQSLGVANSAQGGNFSKYAIWLDRGFVKYEVGGTPDADFSAWLGRFDNPWFGTDLIWDDDLGFDGLALQGRYNVYPGVTPFATIGGFPVFTTDFNFSSNRPDKFPSDDKYLVAAQVGTTWKIRHDLSAKVAFAYYDFINIEGRLSDPFVPLTASDSGNTDDTRPAFAQKGNTYFPLRDILPVPENNFGTTKQFQYFGLATPFRDIAFTGSLTWSHFDPFHVSLTGEWIKNTAFDRTAINAIAINNRGPNLANGATGPFVGGDTAWLINLKFGNAALEKRWDWNAGINYRYIESDSVVDGFNDSDFGLGGTNLKGFEIYGNLAISPRIFVGVRWLSADEVSGPKYSSDIFQLDFNAKF
ncbi:MAG TPA: putative porin [Chthoniobacterales bacterium]